MKSLELRDQDDYMLELRTRKALANYKSPLKDIKSYYKGKRMDLALTRSVGLRKIPWSGCYEFPPPYPPGLSRSFSDKGPDYGIFPYAAPPINPSANAPLCKDCGVRLVPVRRDEATLTESIFSRLKIFSAVGDPTNEDKNISMDNLNVESRNILVKNTPAFVNSRAPLIDHSRVHMVDLSKPRAPFKEPTRVPFNAGPTTMNSTRIPINDTLKVPVIDFASGELEQYRNERVSTSSNYQNPPRISNDSDVFPLGPPLRIMKKNTENKPYHNNNCFVYHAVTEMHNHPKPNPTQAPNSTQVPNSQRPNTYNSPQIERVHNMGHRVTHTSSGISNPTVHEMCTCNANDNQNAVRYYYASNRNENENRHSRRCSNCGDPFSPSRGPCKELLVYIEQDDDEPHNSTHKSVETAQQRTQTDKGEDKQVQVKVKQKRRSTLQTFLRALSPKPAKKISQESIPRRLGPRLTKYSDCLVSGSRNIELMTYLTYEDHDLNCEMQSSDTPTESSHEAAKPQPQLPVTHKLINTPCVAFPCCQRVAFKQVEPKDKEQERTCIEQPITRRKVYGEIRPSFDDKKGTCMDRETQNIFRKQFQPQDTMELELECVCDQENKIGENTKSQYGKEKYDGTEDIDEISPSNITKKSLDEDDITNQGDQNKKEPFKRIFYEKTNKRERPVGKGRKALNVDNDDNQKLSDESDECKCERSASRTVSGDEEVSKSENDSTFDESKYKKKKKRNRSGSFSQIRFFRKFSRKKDPTTIEICTCETPKSHGGKKKKDKKREKHRLNSLLEESEVGCSCGIFDMKTPTFGSNIEDPAVILDESFSDRRLRKTESLRSKHSILSVKTSAIEPGRSSARLLDLEDDVDYVPKAIPLLKRSGKKAYKKYVFGDIESISKKSKSSRKKSEYENSLFRKKKKKIYSSSGSHNESNSTHTSEYADSTSTPYEFEKPLKLISLKKEKFLHEDYIPKHRKLPKKGFPFVEEIHAPIIKHTPKKGITFVEEEHVPKVMKQTSRKGIVFVEEIHDPSIIKQTSNKGISFVEEISTDDVGIEDEYIFERDSNSSTYDVREDAELMSKSTDDLELYNELSSSESSKYVSHPKQRSSIIIVSHSNEQPEHVILDKNKKVRFDENSFVYPIDSMLSEESYPENGLQDFCANYPDVEPMGYPTAVGNQGYNPMVQDSNQSRFEVEMCPHGSSFNIVSNRMNPQFRQFVGSGLFPTPLNMWNRDQETSYVPEDYPPNISFRRRNNYWVYNLNKSNTPSCLDVVNDIKKFKESSTESALNKNIEYLTRRKEILTLTSDSNLLNLRTISSQIHPSLNLQTAMNALNKLSLENVSKPYGGEDPKVYTCFCRNFPRQEQEPSPVQEEESSEPNSTDMECVEQTLDSIFPDLKEQMSRRDDLDVMSLIAHILGVKHPLVQPVGVVLKRPKDPSQAKVGEGDKKEGKAKINIQRLEKKVDREMKTLDEELEKRKALVGTLKQKITEEKDRLQSEKQRLTHRTNELENLDIKLPNATGEDIEQPETPVPGKKGKSSGKKKEKEKKKSTKKMGKRDSPIPKKKSKVSEESLKDPEDKDK